MNASDVQFTPLRISTNVATGNIGSVLYLDKMFEQLVALMNDELAFERVNNFTKEMEAPKWL